MKEQASLGALVNAADQRPALRRAVQELSGTGLLKAILELPNARQVVQELAPTDFFWLVKQIGEEDSLPLLELASTEQWQHLVDLEVWRRDRIHLDEMNSWIKRLHGADPERLALWLMQKDDLLAGFLLNRLLDVTVRDHDTDEVPDGFFSLDGVYYLRVRDPQQEDWIRELMADMARLDYGGYQRLLLGMLEYLPSEAEEELYRLRNFRLAEKGFVPWEEAQQVYAPLGPEAVMQGTPEVARALILADEDRDLVPMIPLEQGQIGGLLARSLEGIQDPIVLDRIRLEFAGLVNQILSAEGVPVNDLEVMGRACRRAASYLNLALERLGLGNLSKAGELVAEVALVSLFRVGYGMALNLGWRARRWVHGSWFRKMGLKPGFWGESWGSSLEGLLRKRPARFCGADQAEDFRDFIHLEELEEASKILERLRILDSLLESLVERYPLDRGLLAHPEATFHPLIFNLWGACMLGKKGSISPMELGDAMKFLRLLRSRDRRAPYKMPGFEKEFVKFFLEHVPEKDRELLSQTMSIIWREFRDEYERIPLEELNAKFSRLIRIRA